MTWFFKFTFRHANGEFRTVEIEKPFDPDVRLLSKVFDAAQADIAAAIGENESMWQIEMSRRAV